VNGAGGVPGLISASPGPFAFPSDSPKPVGAGEGGIGIAVDGRITVVGVVVANRVLEVVVSVVAPAESVDKGVSDDGKRTTEDSRTAEVLELTGLGAGWLATGAGSLPVFPNLSGMACRLRSCLRPSGNGET
jgi:hypothetical protein